MSLNSEMWEIDVTQRVKDTLECIEFDTVAEFPIDPNKMITYLKNAFPNLKQLLFTNIPIDLEFNHIHKHRIFLQEMLKWGENLKKFGITIFPQSPNLSRYE